MFLKKRDGTECKFDMDIFCRFLLRMAIGLNCHLHYIVIPPRNVWDIVELYEYLSKSIDDLSCYQQDFALLAGRVYMDKIIRPLNQSMNFFESLQRLNHAGLISPELLNYSADEQLKIYNTLDQLKDYTYTYKQIRWMEDLYLKKFKGFIERPQYMFMRLALTIHGHDTDSACRSYQNMSNKYFIHSSSTLKTLGQSSITNNEQFKSFSYTIRVDFTHATIYNMEPLLNELMDSIFYKKCDFNNVSVDLSKVPSMQTADVIDIVPILSIFNSSLYFRHTKNQHINVTIELWHSDLNHFLKMSRYVYTESLTYTIIVPDLFMKRVNSDGRWSFMCPKKCPLLLSIECCGNCLNNGDCDNDIEFEKIYTMYEEKNMTTGDVSAHSLWQELITDIGLKSQPHVIFRHTKSNSSYVSVNQTDATEPTSTTVDTIPKITNIKCINTTDNIFYSCEGATVFLPALYKSQTGQFNFIKLREIVKIIVIDLNTIINKKRIVRGVSTLNSDRMTNFSTIEDNRRSMAIGVDGLADLLILMKKTFASSVELNERIFETIYFAAIDESCRLAQYYNFNLPITNKILNLPFWSCRHLYLEREWIELRKRIYLYGVINSSFTIATLNDPVVNICGYNTGCDQFPNLFENCSESRVNLTLVRELSAENTWNKTIEDEILKNNTLENLDQVSPNLKQLFKCGPQIPIDDQLRLINSRSMFIDNLHLKRVFINTSNEVKDIILDSFKLKSKTGYFVFR